jgi:L-asparaginase II
MTESAKGALLVRVVRSGLEESLHHGHVAVCDAEGRLVAFAGDPHREVFARSCMKPLQAAVSLSLIEDELTDREVAVMCASHNGEPVHIETVAALLARGGLGFDALRCPPGWPLDQHSMARAGEQRRELHNCSGKHAGMVLACHRAGWDLETYREPGHPLQARITDTVLLATGLEQVRTGVDGCGVVVHGLPLSRLATLFARLATPVAWAGLEGPVARAGAAMRAETYLVAGRGRVDTAVMEATPDLVAKAGAEGLLCAASLSRGMGVAVKVADGGARADAPALIHALFALGILDDGAVEILASHARPAVLGGGAPVGEMIAGFALHRS